MERRELLVQPNRLEPGTPGVLLDLTPERAGWEFIRFTVRRMASGERLDISARGEECCIVLLSGACEARWDGGTHTLGPRPDVFDAYPWALYLPHGSGGAIRALETTEIAECRSASTRPLAPQLIRPEDCGFEIRGGGNATRQIVDILPPPFPADRLLLCEVFTPGGNWSSYPPHKHDVDNPPVEVDLDETYYYRMRDPRGYGFQRLYTSDGRSDATLKVMHNDLVLVREGYHPFVTAFGYDAYYLNVLAGSRRSMAASDDPAHAAFRHAWPPPDPRVPVVPPPANLAGAR